VQRLEQRRGHAAQVLVQKRGEPELLVHESSAG
jgi:hypothetical protein